MTRTGAVITAAVLLTAAVTADSAHYIPEHNMLIGVYQPNSPGSYSQIDTFAQLTGFSPRIVSYYSTFTQPFATAFAQEAASKGAMTLVQWQPRGSTNAQVASGADDVYITQFAQAVKALDFQVIVSYGQEMNGNWYDWGNVAGNNSAEYVAAYRHVWAVFQQQGVRNVTWLWDPNITYQGAPSLADWYPGDQYTDLVGLDGYFAQPSDTFDSLFALSIQQIRSFTGKPLIIGESGVTGTAGASQIASLFAGASLAGAIGVVYFDEAQSGDPEHQNWRLEENPAALQAFSAAVAAYADRPLHVSTLVAPG